MTIEVQGKADPEKGKKRGRIKDASGMIFQADPSILASVVVGSKYDIQYSDEEFKDFKYRVISEVNEVGKDSMTSVVQAAPQRRDMPPPPLNPQAQLNAGTRAGLYRDSTKDEDISVLAIMKSQQIPPGDRAVIFHALKASALAWRDYKKWQKTLASDMDDEIPYDK
jgi:hypothetical protein